MADEEEEWIDLLQARGTLHIVAELGDGPKRFTDLEEVIPISTSTLDRRLKEGIRLDTWELDRVVDEEGDRKVYRLTSRGENVYRGMEYDGGIEASEKARKHLQKLDEVRRKLIKRLRED